MSRLTYCHPWRIAQRKLAKAVLSFCSILFKIWNSPLTTNVDVLQPASNFRIPRNHFSVLEQIWESKETNIKKQHEKIEKKHLPSGLVDHESILERSNFYTTCSSALLNSLCSYSSSRGRHTIPCGLYFFQIG